MNSNQYFMDIKIILLFISFVFIEKTICNQSYKKYEDKICKNFLNTNYYIKCIVSSNNYKKIEECIDRYGNNIYNRNSTLQSSSINLTYCNNFIINNDFMNEFKISKHLYNCFEKSNNLNHKYGNIECNKFKIDK